MRKTKEDMLQTRQMLLDAAFDCFYEKGYERTSLSDIVQKTNVSRGALYWHFKNKEDVYRAVLAETIKKGDLTQMARNLPFEYKFKDRIIWLFYTSLNDNRYVNFIYKAIVYISSNEKFTDILERLRDLKHRLYLYFLEEIRIYMRLHQIEDSSAETYASMLFLTFEGLFLCKNINLGVISDKDHLESYLNTIFSNFMKPDNEPAQEIMTLSVK